MKTSFISIGICVLFILLVAHPMTLGIGSKVQSTYDSPRLEDYYDVYSLEEIPESIRPIIDDSEEPIVHVEVDGIEYKESISPLQGPPLDSPWPMYCHDVRHTGRSSYSTVDTINEEKWQYPLGGVSYHCAPAIDADDVIYVGREELYAIYPNGTLKWKYEIEGNIETSPAIDENGIIYSGTVWGYPKSYLYAIYPNGTLKWKYPTDDIYSSPVIGDEGTIYFGDSENWKIIAINPDGTSKWVYKTNHVIYSSPSIGPDGTVYCGCHDNYLYALYPNNGTLKWKFKTGNWVHGSPTIGNDGTVYIGSDDTYLYALYPNGTMKWRCSIGYVWGSPSLDENGIIYVGTWGMKFFAIYPNGTIKWVYNAPGRIWFGASAAISSEGIIYFGTTWVDGGDGAFIALNPDGTERWKVVDKGLFETSPVIGKDGTVYACSSSETLYAFGVGELETDANGPYYGLIYEPVHFEGYSKGGYSPHSYYWDFGDNNSSNEEDPEHTYIEPGNYTVILTVTDNTSNTSNDETWAWIQDGNHLPDTPDIDGPNRGNPEITYDYKFIGNDPDESVIYLYVDWDDGSNSSWLGPYDSGKEVTLSHKWSQQKTYIIKCKTRDPYGAESDWAEFEVEIPRNKAVNFNFNLLSWLLERFPNAFSLLRYILGFQ